MKIERLKSLPNREVREFYFTHLKLPYPEDEPERTPHEVDETVESVLEIYHPLDDRPSGLVILRDELVLEIVDVTTGEHIRVTFGEMNADDAADQRFEALVQLALIDSQAMSKSFAEIVTDLEQKECLGAVGTFRSLDDRLKFLGTILETAAALIAT